MVLEAEGNDPEVVPGSMHLSPTKPKKIDKHIKKKKCGKNMHPEDAYEEDSLNSFHALLNYNTIKLFLIKLISNKNSLRQNVLMF